MDEMPRPGTPIQLTLGPMTWRTELLQADEEILLLSLGEILPPDLRRLEGGSRIQCRFHEGSQLGSFEAQVQGLVTLDGRERLALRRPAHVTRNTRRKHVRVACRVAMQLRLPLRNEALTRSRGREFIQMCWVSATTLNISAGGFRAVLTLPRHHVVANHREAHVRFELAGERFRDRRLTFIRRESAYDEPVLAYSFADLSPEEVGRIEDFNLGRLSSGRETEA